MKVAVLSRLAILALMFLSWAGVASAQTLRDDVLVLVNDNSRDSALVGEYYAQQRGIDPQNVVHLRTPDSAFIAWSEFKRLRDQVIDFMQRHTLDDPALPPAVCNDGEPPYYCAASMDQLRAHTRIRYIVTTRGIPSRVVVDGSTLFDPSAPASVDNYLKYWLINHFAQDVRLQFSEREVAFGDGRGMREVVPAVDRELIVGRIDGLDGGHAQALVDRALAAERDGVYGKLHTSYWFRKWRDQSAGAWVNLDWRYQLGLLGEARPECIDYLNFPSSSLEGKTPLYCAVQSGDGPEPAPGNPGSRQPLAENALFYLGWLDGQAAAGGFDALLNWRRDDQCSVTLCADAADPAACRAASTDVFKEINTQCVGVAEGFMGYNHQSWPLSYLAAWPTGWYPNTGNTSWGGTAGGDVNQLAFPEVRTDAGCDDSYSLWFRNSDQIAAPKCYAGSDFTAPPTFDCPDRRRVFLTQKIDLPAVTLDTLSPQAYRIKLAHRGRNIGEPTRLLVRFFVHETGGGDAQIDYGVQELAILPAGDSGWTLAEATFQLDPARHTVSGYDGIKIRLETDVAFAGELGLDAVSIQEKTDCIELAQNRSFTEGHRQAATGDHAVAFLSRLNGVAFWGSVSHHQSGGCAFCDNGLELLVYFLRGLPLGDAVWFNESNNSGVLYGDPLYSPVAVRLAPVNDSDTLSGVVELSGSTVNGRDPTQVDTSYAVDYCAGSDFFVCDQMPGAWQTTGIAGTGGQEAMVLGSWDTAGVAPGEYVLRLKVTSVNKVHGQQQSFYDYYRAQVQAPAPPPAPPSPGTLQFDPVAYGAVEAGGSVQITVTRTGGSAGTVSVPYTVRDGTARTGEDYAASDGVLVFGDGETAQSITITLLDDALQEGDESVLLALGSPAGGASLGAATEALLILADDETGGVVLIQSGGGGGGIDPRLLIAGLALWLLSGARRATRREG